MTLPLREIAVIARDRNGIAVIGNRLCIFGVCGSTWPRVNF